MSFRPALPGTFTVPNSLVDEHLKLAKELHLKVLLWVYRHGETEGLQSLAQWLGRPEGDLADALQFWIDKGLITCGEPGETAQESTRAAIPAAPAAPAVQLTSKPAPLPPARPTASQILARTQEDPHLRELFQTADGVLGRTIGFDGQCMLLMLHDNDGLPVEVIYMLLQYCAQAGKTNNGYIEAAGRDWGKREIDTIEKAGEQIAALKENLSLWKEFRQQTGIHAPRPTAAQSNFLQSWRAMGYGIDMILAAYEEMAEHTGKLSFSYMNKVMESWHAAGIKTPEQAAAAKANFQAGRAKEKAAPAKPAKKGKQEGAAGYDPSFDLEAFERSTLQVPVFEG